MKTLIPIGGNINKKNPLVLREFVQRAGGNTARIAILPQASALEDTGEYYVQVFTDLGAARAETLDFRSRAEAGEEKFTRSIEAATGIFIAGGAQLRLTTLIGATPLEAALLSACERGTVIAGTSAGAAVMPKIMTAYGKGGSTPREHMAQFVPGLGFTQAFAIDQHFRQRDRLGRLIYLISMHPGLTGLGIDEDTAAIIENDQLITVCGTGAVTVVDGSGISASDVAEIENGGPIAVSNICVHVLTHGCTYDAHTRTARIPKKISLAE